MATSTSTNSTPGMPATTDEPGTLDQVKQSVGEVAGTATDEVRHVADEARAQATSLAGAFKEQVDQQSRSGLDQLTQILSTFAEDLDALASGRGGQDGMAADLVRQASGRAQSLTQSLQGRSPGDLVRSVEDFGRRRPGAFLLAAAAAGAAAGRLAKGAIADSQEHGDVDLRDQSASMPRGGSGGSVEAPGIGIPGMGEPGGNGPGSLGAEALTGDFSLEEGNAPRTGAGQGLRAEQRHADSSWSPSDAIGSSDDMPGGPADLPDVDEAVQRSGFGRVPGPEVQP